MPLCLTTCNFPCFHAFLVFITSVFPISYHVSPPAHCQSCSMFLISSGSPTVRHANHPVPFSNPSCSSPLTNPIQSPLISLPPKIYRYTAYNKIQRPTLYPLFCRLWLSLTRLVFNSIINTLRWGDTFPPFMTLHNLTLL